jgi:phage/plasmid-like protein (TIGR03299 family)
MSIREGLEYARMADWDVRKEAHRALVHDSNGKEVIAESEGQFNIVRDNPFTGQPEVLGTVGARWTPFQNEDAATLLEDIAGMSGATMVNALVLNGGRKTGLVLKLPEGFVFTSPITGAQDVTDLNLVVFNSHNGGGSLTANLTPIRLWCMNQQRAVESTARSRFSLRHTGDAVGRIAQLREMLDESFSFRGLFQEQMERMIERELDDVQVRKELERLFHAADLDLTDRQREIRMETVGNVVGLYNSSESVAPFAGTAYGLYNAITEYTDHKMRVIVPDGGNETEVRALRTLQSDDLDAFKQRAFAQLLPADAAA